MATADPSTNPSETTIKQTLVIAGLVTRMDRLDARLASLENAYADVRRAQNDAEAKTTLIIGPRPPDKS